MTHCDTQWTAAWLHYAVCSSFSFICNRSENPEHSWGYQTVLLCYLLCGRSESRLGAQVSMQKLCKSQCNFVFIDSESICVYEKRSRFLLISHESFSQFRWIPPMWNHYESEVVVVQGHPVVSLVGQKVLCHGMLSGLCCFRALPTSWMGAASFPESVLRSDANMTWDWQDLKEASTMGSEIPSLEVCLSRSHSSQELGQVGTSS